MSHGRCSTTRPAGSSRTCIPDSTWDKVGSTPGARQLGRQRHRADRRPADRRRRRRRTSPGCSAPRRPFTCGTTARIGGTLAPPAAEQAAGRPPREAVTPRAPRQSRTSTRSADLPGGRRQRQAVGRYPTPHRERHRGQAAGDLRRARPAVREYCLREPAGGGSFQYVAGTDLAGQQLYHVSMDGGARRVPSDVTGKPIRSWDARGHAFRLSLRRRPAADPPLRQATGGAPESSSSCLDLRRGQPGSQPRRPRCSATTTRPARASNDALDYKGNLTRRTRQLAAELPRRARLDAARRPHRSRSARQRRDRRRADPSRRRADRFAAMTTYRRAQPRRSSRHAAQRGR